MRVTILPAGSDPVDRSPGRPVATPAGYGGWQPAVVLGAPAPGGLLLPPAHPTASWLYGPRAVYLDDEIVVVADTGNHRVLIWHGLPHTDGAPADVVLGQPDDHTEGPAAGGRGADGGMHLPTGIVRDGDRLVIADAWHHRLLIWDTIPTQTDTPPDHVVGQPDSTSVEPNSGGDAGAGTFYWPFGISLIDGRFYVADTGNRRVLIWNDGIPAPGRLPDVILGQPDEHAREENRGGAITGNSFRWPHAFAGGGPLGEGGVWIADAGNHRVLGWNTHPDADRPADVVLGQPDFSSGGEFPYVPQIDRLRFPYGIASQGADLAISDTANNRILLQPGPIDSLSAQVSLAQPDLAANGENRWDQVAADTLCWPYGVHWHRGDSEVMAVADSGNNRVVLWRRS